MAGYTRQSTFADGDTITAALFNNEYNQLVNAFSNTTGHSHDGTAANGPVIGLIGDAGETSPNNKVVIDTTNNYIEFYVEVSSAPVQQLYIADGAIIPVTDSDIDLGTTGLRFKDAYIDSITTTGNISVGGNITVTGDATISGNLTFGDADTDTITIGADVASHITPDTDDTYDLGSSTKEWRNLYIDGTANIDSLVADTADINGGTIDGATIATSDITVGAGKTLNVSAGTLTLADDQISGDKVEGGTIAATTITDLTFGSLNDGTITVTAFADEDDMSSNSATLVPTQQSVKAYVDSQVTAQDLDFQGDTGGALSIDLDSESLTIAGGTGLDTVGSGNTVTINIDSTVATLTGSQTLTNKTIDVDNNTVSNIEVDNLKSGVLDTDLTSVAATDTTLASAKAIKTYVDAQVTAQDLDFAGDTGGALSIDLDSESLTIAGGTGIDTVGASNTLTVAIDSTVATLTGTQTLTNKTLTSPVLNTSVSGTAFLDDDTFATATSTTLASSESIKAYVDAQILTEDTLAELNDTNITSPADGALLFYDTGTSMWIDNVVSGDITIADTGVAAISSGVIVNDDINASAAISISKTALVDGTGLTLTGDTLAVDASQTQITSVGTLDSLTVSGDLTIDTSTLKVDSTNNRVGILNATPDVTLDIGSATDAIHMPVGTTAQRPTGAAGYFRYNTDLGQFEGYTDEWGSIAGSGGASAVEQQIFAGTGSQTDFTLTTAPATENNLLVFIDGVFQAQDSYSVSGTTLTFSTAPVSGRVITVYHVRSSVSGANMIVDSMTGDGSDTTLTLSVAPVSVNNIQVYFDGVYQAKSNYSVSGTTLTFTTAPPSGVAVEAITHTQTSVNVPVDGTITPAKIASGDFYFDTDTLYIDATNNRVGIGATSLNADLHIGSANAVGDATNPAFQIGGSPTGNTYRLGLYTSAEGGVIENKNGDDGLQFKVKTAGEAMRIDGGTGNVGIGGTPVAGAKLQSQGALFVNGVISAAPSSPTLAIDYASGGARFISYDHSTNNPRIYFITSSSTSTNERMRIDSSGTLLVGTTDDAHYGGSTNSGFAVTNSGITGISRSAGTVLYVNRQTSDGDIITFRKDGSTKGRIGTKGGDVFIGGDTHLRFTTGDIRPCDSNGDNQDNFTDLGDSSARFDDIFATNGTIQTSDRNEKQDIAELTDAETRVAVAAKGLLRKFRWQSAVEEKGDEARIHFGIIAQDLQDAFTAEGLDAGDYAMFISSTWTDDDGVEQTRLGVRYSELLAFIIAGI